MAHYNLIKNGILETNTTSGTGNTTFSGSEMVSLYDGNITSSGIVLTAANTVYFEIDLFNRILLDELSISFSVSGTMDTALSGIDFYYKDNFQDVYTLLDKAHDASQTFYANNLITHFAPRYIRIISDGVEGTLHELMVYNDDYIIAFGEDGTQDEIILDEFVEYTELQIFNNNPIETPEVDAYVSVDYEYENEFNYYLTLASSPDGEYKGILDGAGIDNNSITPYTWEMGHFDATKVVNNSVELTAAAFIGHNSAGSWSTSNPLSQQAKYGFGTNSYYSTNISLDCWDWDEVDTVYAMGRLITDDILKLYKYPLDEGVWSFISRVDILISVNSSAMVYLDEYLYILTGRAGAFGRYDLSGPVNNWEALATASNSAVTKANQAMCSDKQRYIYTASVHETVSWESFARYDTVSGTWTDLNDGFDKHSSGSYDGYNLTLTHDKERNCIYLYSGRCNTGTQDHIQRYDIPTDAWDPYWYYIYNNMVDTSFGYWSDYFCYAIGGSVDKLYVLNLNTTDQYSFDIDNVPLYHSTHLMCLSYNNRIIVVRCGNESSSTPGTIWFYDVAPEPETAQIGEYTTPIFSIKDSYEAAYLHIDTSTSNENKVSYSDGAANTVMVRSNDTPPSPFLKILAGGLGTDDYFYLIEGDLITGALLNPADYVYVSDYDPGLVGSYYIDRVLFDSYNLGVIIQLREHYSTSSYWFARYEYNTSGGLSYKAKTGSSSYYTFTAIRHLALDLQGNIWMYNSNHLILIQSTTMSETLNITDNANDFVHTLSPNKLYLACWYTNKAQKKVVNIDVNGTEICSIPMIDPTLISATSDGGCFVLDDLEHKIYKLDYTGSILNSFSVDTVYSINHLAAENTESAERFMWVLVNNAKVIKINTEGIVEGEVITTLATSIQTFPGGCLVYAASLQKTYQLDVSLNILKTWDFSGISGLTYVSDPAFSSYNDMLYGLGSGLRERTNDPIWNDSTDDWYEVSIEENNLPLKKYHQVKLKLQADYGADSPSINKVLIPEPAKITGIQAQGSKPVYLKTTFPASEENKTYNTKLKCWWGNKEE